MSKRKDSQKKYICCRYCMETNPTLLDPCVKHREGTDFKMYACPKKERHEPNSEKLKPKWEEISEAEFLEIYEQSKLLKANTDIILQKNNKIYHIYSKRVQDKDSNN